MQVTESLSFKSAKKFIILTIRVRLINSILAKTIDPNINEMDEDIYSALKELWEDPGVQVF